MPRINREMFKRAGRHCGAPRPARFVRNGPELKVK